MDLGERLKKADAAICQAALGTGVQELQQFRSCRIRKGSSLGGAIQGTSVRALTRPSKADKFRLRRPKVSSRDVRPIKTRNGIRSSHCRATLDAAFRPDQGEQSDPISGMVAGKSILGPPRPSFPLRLVRSRPGRLLGCNRRIF